MTYEVMSNDKTSSRNMERQKVSFSIDSVMLKPTISGGNLLADQFQLREKTSFDLENCRRLLDRRVDESTGQHMQALVEVEGFEWRTETWARKEIVVVIHQDGGSGPTCGTTRRFCNLQTVIFN